MDNFNAARNSLEIQYHNQICEAIDCNKQATENIPVSAGKHGTIEIYVCKNCVCKFQGDNSDD